MTVVLALAAGIGCNRADTREQARQAGAEVRELGLRAGDRLADGWLTTKIQAQYFADEDIKLRQIDVSARNGVVTLRGVVDSGRAREQALGIARATDGVRTVEDQLFVASNAAARAALPQPEPSQEPIGTAGTQPAAVAPEGPVDDDAIATRIQTRYFMDTSLKARRIEVSAQRGVVTLRGEVGSDNERAQALLLAWTTPGVEHVDDALVVQQTSVPATAAPGTPAPPAASQDAALEQRVRAALASDRQASADAVQVTARDGVLLLEGRVPTAAARQRVLSAARGVEGVVQVVDRLSLAR
ncbi:MAG: hypothetical protein A3F70_15855 [Acidobacteria bacterium RIFCSPLOWO2_12_FULL_67_14]|nr:MAG: hypothetical protein A3H29_09385 [Acidobacteria bacterium RIFCSPLOWO2_02_FULL_67_21]OFW34883.1 MAG: hypothetical protein A3F70_15855 [Acidobacteria bacterium RIFCSPLOWO2_12_FULL_67_14]